MPRLLVDPGWLEGHLGDRRVRIVDLRDREAYGEEHIAGAVQLDLEDLGEDRDGCDNVVLCPADFERVMARIGISNRHTVVAYDDHWGLPSARLVWALHHYGLRSVGVLNGGWDRWHEEERPTTGRPSPEGPPLEPTGPPLERADGFEAHVNPDVAAELEWIVDRLGREGVVFLDTRSHTEFDHSITACDFPMAAIWPS